MAHSPFLLPTPYPLPLFPESILRGHPLDQHQKEEIGTCNTAHGLRVAPASHLATMLGAPPPSFPPVAGSPTGLKRAACHGMTTFGKAGVEKNKLWYRGRPDSFLFGLVSGILPHMQNFQGCFFSLNVPQKDIILAYAHT